MKNNGSSFELGFKFLSSINSFKDCGLSKAFFITLLEVDEKILLAAVNILPAVVN